MCPLATYLLWNVNYIIRLPSLLIYYILSSLLHLIISQKLYLRPQLLVNQQPYVWCKGKLKSKSRLLYRAVRRAILAVLFAARQQARIDGPTCHGSRRQPFILPA